ncbi:hypothetical protein [Blautia obeum]|uniref:hypothetical protein n=1 Tax=Blautia obeum TaxID=40520 RepID=UPI0015FDF3B5|nr:hypothetical protein [Blautia obeum]
MIIYVSLPSSEDPFNQQSSGYFTEKTRNRLLLLIINKGEITGAVDIDNMYEFASSHYNDFKDLRNDKDIVINREWILNKLAETENE